MFEEERFTMPSDKLQFEPSPCQTESSHAGGKRRLNKIRILEGVGAVAGIVGAGLIASNTQLSGYGWIGFSISSVTLAAFAIYIRAWWMLSMQVCFSITNAVGLWRWLIEPAIVASIQ